MTVIAYSDASCNSMGCAWGGVLLGPDSVLVTCGDVLPRAADSWRAELRGAACVLRRAEQEWPRQVVHLYLDCQSVAETLRRALESGFAISDPWADSYLAPLRQNIVRVRWLQRKAPEIALCDALSRYALTLADPTTTRPQRRGARLSVLIKQARILQPRDQAELTPQLQRTLHTMLRMGRRGDRHSGGDWRHGKV